MRMTAALLFMENDHSWLIFQPELLFAPHNRVFIDTDRHILGFRAFNESENRNWQHLVPRLIA